MLWKLARQLTRKSICERKSVTCTASAGSLCAPRLKLPSWLRRKIGFGPVATGVFDCARRKALRILSPPVKPRPKREKSANEAYNIDRFPPCPSYLVYLAEIVDRKDQLLPSQTGGGRSAHGNNISSKQSSRPAGENE